MLKCRNRYRLFIAYFALSFAPSLGAGQIAWRFTTDTSPTIDLVDALSAGVVAFHQNGGTTSLDLSQPSSGYSGASGGNNLNVGSAKSGAFDASTSTYFAFTLSPDAGHAVNVTGLTFGSRSTASGPTALTLFSSLDNYATAVAGTTAVNNSSWALLDFGTLNLTSAAGTSLTFRIYGSAGTSTAGSNWRIDDVTVVASAVPEPAAAAALAGATALACVLHRRRRQR